MHVFDRQPPDLWLAVQSYIGVPAEKRACACWQVLEAEKETTPKIEAKAQELKEQTKDVREEVGARAKDLMGSAKEVQKEAVGSAKEVQKEAVSSATEVQKEAVGSAKEVQKEAVSSAKEVQKEASAQVEDTVNVAQDTIDLVSVRLCPLRVSAT